MFRLQNNTTSEDHVAAIQALLYDGVVPVTTKEALELALAKPDEEQFVATWTEVMQQPDVLKQLSQDGAFLDDVKDSMSPSTFALVEATFTRGDELGSEVDEEKVSPLVDACLRELDELRDFWVNDATVLDALKGLDAKLEALFSESGGALQLEMLRITARSMLHNRFEALYGAPLVERIERGLQGAGETQAIALVQIPSGMSAGKAGLGAEEWDQQTEAISLQFATKIRGEMEGLLYVSDANVGSLFEAAYSAMRGPAEAAAGSDLARVVELSDQGMQRLKDNYDQQFGSLVDDLHSYVQTDDIRNRALTLIGDRFDPSKLVMTDALSCQVGSGDEDKEPRQAGQHAGGPEGHHGVRGAPRERADVAERTGREPDRCELQRLEREPQGSGRWAESGGLRPHAGGVLPAPGRVAEARDRAAPHGPARRDGPGVVRAAGPGIVRAGGGGRGCCGAD